MNNKVVIVGVLDTKESTNVSIARAFSRFGFKIIPINYRSIIQKYKYQFFENLVVATIRKYRPQLCIFCKCNGVSPDIVKECNKYTKTFHWFMDPVITAKGCPEVIEMAKNCNFSSCTAGGTNEYFKQCGVINSIHIFDGLDYNLYHPVEPVAKYEADISFIGGKNQERNRYKRFLEDNKYNVKFYGPGYSGYINHIEFSKICSSSKFMLSINNEQLENYFSNRLLRYLGTGTCVLHYDPTKTLHKYFNNVLFFSTGAELLDLIENTSLEKAGELAFRGRDEVLNKFTWEHVVQKILRIIQ